MVMYNDVTPVNKPKEFVCLFPFNSNMSQVALVNKSKGPTPERADGQLGRCSGWGGKIEDTDLDALNALRRECHEEMGFDVNEIQFHRFSKEQYGNEIIVHYFYCADNKLFDMLSKMFKNQDNDLVVLRSVFDIVTYSIRNPLLYVWNVPYLIMTARALNELPFNSWPINSNV